MASPVLAALAAALLALPEPSPGPAAGPRAESPAATRRGGFMPAEACASCHPALADAWRGSVHAAAARDPIFVAEYEELRARAADDATWRAAARSCLGCHDPVTARALGPRGEPPPPAELAGGVTCHFCHSISAFAGAAPGDANQVLHPDPDRVLGPDPRGSAGWHTAQGALHASSALCATCHEGRSPLGAPLRTTFNEWRRSAWARAGVQCQDCHMSPLGHAGPGGPVRVPGVATTLPLDGPGPERPALHVHAFPGGHEAAQLAAAAALRVELASPRPAYRAGEPIDVAVLVENRGAGHRLPTGCPDLRVLWLEVTLEGASGQVHAIPAQTALAAGPRLDLAGGADLDAVLIGDVVPEWSRVYRAVLLDHRGLPTDRGYAAATVAFDNRLDPSEVRVERYRAIVPDDLAGPARVRVRLRSLAVPPGTSAVMGLPAPEPVTLATAERRLLVR